MNTDELQQVWGCIFHVSENWEIVISLNTESIMVFLAECGFQLNPCVDLVMNAVEETCSACGR
jgi:hypothetical protein